METIIPGRSTTYRLGACSVAIFGHEPRIADKPFAAIGGAGRFGIPPERTALCIVASNKDAPGYKGIVVNTLGETKFADGILLTEGNSAGGIQTADCAGIAFYDEVTENAILVHGGRPALTGDDHCASCTIVTHALDHLTGPTGDRSRVHALVVGNICGDCFEHVGEGADVYIEPFLKYPPQVFKDRSRGALDLYEVIKHDLIHHGVPEANIQHEGPCTKESNWLSSHRRGDKTRNTIILVRY